MLRPWFPALCCALMFACSTDKPEPEEMREEDAKETRDAGSSKDRRDAAAQRDTSMSTDEEPAEDASAPAVDAAPLDAGRTAPPGDPDGDPSAPIVAIPDVKCGGPGRSPLGSANLKVGGRDVILTYPCMKHEGAQVVFILNLHGTMATENLKFYQHGYFAAHALTDSHNVIVATPKSRASQWGNVMENPAASEDRQHLLDVIDYVYKNLGKFNITGLWVGGHSWGSVYAKRFVCEEAIKDKARGVIGMSGGTTAPGRSFGQTDLKLTSDCASYISQIHTVGDTDSFAGLPDQAAPAAAHGCDAKTAPVDLGAKQMSEQWPSCDPGWIHENITMGDHSHTTSINPEVVEHIVAQIKIAEAR